MVSTKLLVLRAETTSHLVGKTLGFIMQSYKRLFIGTFLKTDALISEYPKIKREFEVAVTGKWVEEWNLHFTYHFLGNVSVEVIPEILKELEPILKEYSYELTLHGLGCFPSLNSPRVLYVNIKESEKLLKQIHTSCSEVLTKLNFEIEQREYKPHLTLLRIKSFKLNFFRKSFKKYENFDFGVVEEFKVELIESRLTSEGPIYEPIKNLP